MFHPFLPDPTVFAFPALAQNVTKDFELVQALDVSSYKTGAFFLRLHAGAFPSGNANLVVTIEAQKIWPGELRDPLFNIISIPSFLVSAPVNPNTLNGDLLEMAQTTLNAPALRIFVRFTASGGATNAGNITLSAGILLLAS